MLSLASIVLITFVMASMALGFGAMFPRFGTENAAQIPTSFGGLIFMMSATAYLALVIALEARPLYRILYDQSRGQLPDRGDYMELAIALAIVLAISAAAIVLPLRIAVTKVAELET